MLNMSEHRVRPFVAFDLEIASEIPEGTDDWRALGPLGMTCAAVYGSDLRKPIAWWAGLQRPGDATPSDCPRPERMTVDECRQVAAYLVHKHGHGFDVVTWNGMGFDLAVLVQECAFDDPDHARPLVELAWSHVDVPYQMLCERGFMVSLQAASLGMGLEGKAQGIAGADAPAVWRAGRAEQDRLIDYVRQDAAATAILYEAILHRRELAWIARSGRTCLTPWAPSVREDAEGARLLTVAEAGELPLPDTSWLDDPWPRSRFTEWAAQTQKGDSDR